MTQRLQYMSRRLGALVGLLVLLGGNVPGVAAQVPTGLGASTPAVAGDEDWDTHFGVPGLNGTRTHIGTAKAPIAPANVGYRIVDFAYTLPDGSRKPLTMAIWYPTTAQPQSYNYKRTFAAGKVALNSPVKRMYAARGNPLIVHSHGWQYCGNSSAYINEYLASRGYIVVAPDHEDVRFCRIKGGTASGQPWNIAQPVEVNFPHRPLDLRAVIDEMLRLNQDSASAFSNTIDADAIAVSGWSLGGWTAGMVGGEYPVYRDTRVKAALMMAAGHGSYAPENYANMNIPVMYQLGEYDSVNIGQPIPEKRYAYDSAEAPKFLPIVAGAYHYVFSDATCSVYVTIENCLRNNPRAKVITRYAGAFLDYYLNKDEDALLILSSSDLRLSSYEFELKAPLAGTDPSNLMSNGGFERDADQDGWPDAWPRDPHIARVLDPVHSGAYALQLEANDDATIVTSQGIPDVLAGEPLGFSAWTSIPSTTDTFTMRYLIRWRDSAQRILATSTAARFTQPTNGWVHSTMELVPPAGTTNALVQVVATSLHGTVVVDDLFLGNLLLNAGFERDTNEDGLPDAWMHNVHLQRADGAARSGSAGLRYSGDDAAVAMIVQRVSVVVGQSYRVAGWLRIPATTDMFTARIDVVWLDPSAEPISTSMVSTYRTATSDWVQARRTVTAPAGAATAQVQLTVRGLTGALDFDDLAFWP